MLKKSSRLTKRRDFEKLRRAGRRIMAPNIMLKYCFDGAHPPRIAFIVSKRVDRRATIRNRIKRQMRAVVSGRYSALRPNIDLLIVAQPKIVSATFAEIKRTLESALRQISTP